MEHKYKNIKLSYNEMPPRKPHIIMTDAFLYCLAIVTLYCCVCTAFCCSIFRIYHYIRDKIIMRKQNRHQIYHDMLPSPNNTIVEEDCSEVSII